MENSNLTKNDATAETAKAGSSRQRRRRQRLIVGIVAAVAVLFGVVAYGASNSSKQLSGTLIINGCELDPVKGVNISCSGGGTTQLLDLSGRDLRGVNLAGATLDYTNFSNSDLRGANFAGASLVGTSLNSALLQGANFRWANLTNADLSGSNLRGADLTGAFLPTASSAYISTICPNGSETGIVPRCDAYV